MDKISFSVFALNALVAAIGGLVIGLEREYKGKSAGLKTNAIVAIGASIFVMISLQFIDHSNTDITRVLGQVVAGVGFLGAGVILQKERKNLVRGLTTAATIWCSAAIGCLAAVGMYAELLFTVALLIGINLFIGMFSVKKSLQIEDNDQHKKNKKE